MRIGLISDTHGYLNSKVFDVFAYVQYILHAGDVGDDRILDELQEVAPTFAVSGNVDGSPTKRRPLRFVQEFSGAVIAMTHGHLLDPSRYNESALELFAAEKPALIIHGHSHRAKNETLGDVIVVNPGAACKPRFKDISSVAVLEIELGGHLRVEFKELPKR